MKHKTAPQYPGSMKDFEKKKSYLFIGSLILLGVSYAFCSLIKERSEIFGTVILVASWILIFVANQSIEKWLKNDYYEKRRVWCDFWESYQEELDQMKREYETLPDGDEKLDLAYQIKMMENYYHKFDNYA